MGVKQYRCNVGHLSFSVMIGGKQRWLKFRGAKADEGFFSTGDVAEQRAIETSKRYLRGEIKCVGEYVVPDEVMSEAVDVEPVAEVVKEVNGIATVQAAREYLVAEKGAKASELNNREAVLAYAERVGVKFAEL